MQMELFKANHIVFIIAAILENTARESEQEEKKSKTIKQSPACKSVLSSNGIFTISVRQNRHVSTRWSLPGNIVNSTNIDSEHEM